MTASASVWRSKCPYNIADPEDLDPCPHCDADNPVPAPSVGHVCVGPPSSRKPRLCWICGQFLPHDCVGSAQPVGATRGSVTVSPAGANVLIGTIHDQPRFLVERADVADLIACLVRAYACAQPAKDKLDGFALLPDAHVTHGPPSNAATNTHPAQFHLDIITARVQSWLDKQGHDRCWYYPEIFESIAEELDLARTIAPSLPPCAEFMKGCERYQAEQYSQVGLQAAKRLAPPIAPTGRKWPIGTPDEHTWKLASDSCRDDHGPSYEWHLRLAAARTRRGLTLDALARRLDPPRTRKDISAMEHGRRGLSVELCAQLADALDCDRLWLAGWTL